MASFTFGTNTTSKIKKPVVKKSKEITLIKHITQNNSTEYYSYLNADGVEVKYSGSITKKGNNYFGKIIESHKVILTYHPEVEHVDGNDVYFTYIDNKGNERIYSNEVLQDKESLTYTGIIDVEELKDTIIEIFAEE